MAIPTYEDFMLPVLRKLADGQTYRLRDLYPILASQFQMTPEEREKRPPSGVWRVVDNRIHWRGHISRPLDL